MSPGVYEVIVAVPDASKTCSYHVEIKPGSKASLNVALNTCTLNNPPVYEPIMDLARAMGQ